MALEVSQTTCGCLFSLSGLFFWGVCSSATVSQSEPLAFAKQTFTNQTEEKNPFNNWLDVAQETGRELLDQGQNHLNTQWNTAKHKGVNLLKQGFDYIDQNQLGATNNSAMDFTKDNLNQITDYELKKQKEQRGKGKK